MSLEAVAERIGADARVLAAGVPEFKGDQTYRVLNPRGERCEALAISRANGRFGNNFRQLVHVVRLAKRLGIGRIYVPELSQFAVPNGRAEAGGIKFIAFADVEMIRESTLCGTFFYKQSFGKLLDGNAVEQQGIVNTCVAPLCTALRHLEPTPANHIALHIRSGDLFDRDNPHPNYPQPPLAFYEMAVEWFIAHVDAAHATLVFQDRGNPVVDALEAWLEAMGVEARTQSAALDEDLRTLLAHPVLAFGRGTFGKAVFCLSPHARTVFFPWTDRDFHGLTRAKGAEGVCVSEARPGEYIQTGEWKNTPAQRELMLAFPRERLIMESDK